jgi:hypothetical protein
VCKFVEKEGELHAEVVPWNRVICDSVDFENNVKIEKLWLTPAQLRKNKAYDQSYVEELIDKVSVSRELFDRQRKDNKSEYIPVYEVSGEMPLSLLTDKEEDDDIYVQQMHHVCFSEKNEKDQSGKSAYNDYTLYKGKQKEDPYLLTHLIPEDGRVQGIGAVEHLFEAQWMVNHSQKSIKDQLDLASKLIFQTADGSFVGRNALTSIETGDILIHQMNQPLTEINNTGHDITSLQSFGGQWQALAKEITSTPDSIAGNSMPSGTAYRQVAILNQESHSLFELMIENKALYLEEILRKFVIPFLKTKMDTSEEIMAELDPKMLAQIDSFYLPNEATRRSNAELINQVLAGEDVDENTQQEIMDTKTREVQNELNAMGNTRSFTPEDISSTTWKKFFKDFEWECEVVITNESTNKEVMMTTLTTIMQTIAGLQGQPMTPEMKIIFNRILEMAGGISPIEIPKEQNQAPVLVGGQMPGANLPAAPIQ